MLTSVDVTPGEDFLVSRPRPLIGPLRFVTAPRPYDVLADGPFFMVVDRGNAYAGRWLLNHQTHSRVASSRSSSLEQGRAG